MIDAYASQPHYLDHLAPIWQALPPGERGRFFVADGLAGRAARQGIAVSAENVREGPTAGDGPCLVAGYADQRRAAHRPVVYVEHGAGQTYPGGDGRGSRMSGYPGGVGHDGAVLFVVPGPHAAGPWRREYPCVPVVEVGCPRLDGLHAVPRARARSSRPTVGVAFHWLCPLVPETKGAWLQYAEHLPALVAELHRMGWNVLGHAHPRIWRRASAVWAQAGAEPVADLDVLLRRVDVLAVDNTSAGPEAASAGVPVVWLNPPWFRRDVDHGGRFWAWPDGQVQCDEPARLPGAVADAFADPPGARQSREAMVADCYTACDGRAAARAAHATLSYTAV